MVKNANICKFLTILGKKVEENGGKAINVKGSLLIPSLPNSGDFK